MIEIDKPLSDREPLEVLELNYYRFRLHDDNLVRAMEKIQAAAVQLVALEEEQPGPAGVRASAASNSLMLAYKELAKERSENQVTLKGLASYLAMHEVELFDSMQDLLLAQELLKQVDEEQGLD